MIEEIKELSAELQIKPFGDSRVFEESKVKIIYPRSVEKSASGIALEAHGRGRERRDDKVLAARFSWVLLDHGTHLIRRVHRKNDRAAKTGA